MKVLAAALTAVAVLAVSVPAHAVLDPKTSVFALVSTYKGTRGYAPAQPTFHTTSSACTKAKAVLVKTRVTNDLGGTWTAACRPVPRNTWLYMDNVRNPSAFVSTHRSVEECRTMVSGKRWGCVLVDQRLRVQ